jgi:HSP20 family protein
MANEQKRQSERQESTAMERSGSGERGVATRQYHDPFAAFDALFDRMQQNMFGTSLFNALWPMRSGEATGGSGIRVPRVQMHDAGDAIELTAEMPGIDPSNVSVDVEGDVLTISGEQRTQDEQEGARSERYSSFHRQIGLPDGIDTEKAEASCKNGMLTIRFPKTRSNARKIDIAVEGGQQQKQSKERAA